MAARCSASNAQVDEEKKKAVMRDCSEAGASDSSYLCKLSWMHSLHVGPQIATCCVIFMLYLNYWVFLLNIPMSCTKLKHWPNITCCSGEISSLTVSSEFSASLVSVGFVIKKLEEDIYYGNEITCEE